LAAPLTQIIRRKKETLIEFENILLFSGQGQEENITETRQIISQCQVMAFLFDAFETLEL
jgi:hypothetical protein